MVSGVAPPGQVLGVGGSGLVDADWAASRRVAEMGRVGEVLTARILNPLARRPGGPSVAHHVTPPGGTADVDHVLISGSRVVLIDSKRWRPGVYWTFGGVHRRAESLLSMEVAEHVPSLEQVARMQERMGRALAGSGARIEGPLFVIWPSREGGRVSVQMLNLGAGTQVVPGGQFERVARRLARGGSADRGIVQKVALMLGEGD